MSTHRSSLAAVAVAPPVQRRDRLAMAMVSLVTLLVLAILVAAAPQPVLGATSLSAKCGANLRTRPSTSASVRVSIPTGTRVVASAVVSGGRWTVRCGRSVTSTRWYRITSVGGRTVQSRYGVPYLYAATNLFKSYVAPVVPVTLAAACAGVNVRTGTTTATAAKDRLLFGEKVVTTGAVAGGTWTATCGTTTVSGTAWYRITAVGGTSVRSLYGVDVVYGAKGLFVPPSALASPTPSPSPSPTPAPTPPPTPAPTPAPTAPPSPTPDPSASPTASPTPTPTPSPTSTWIEGIDVSHWQGTIDWTLVAGAGKRFAFLKASDSVDFVDWTYATNRAAANAAGLLVGAYHFARPDATPGDAVAEADLFARTAAPATGDLLPVLDLEDAGGLGTAALQTWVRTFLDRVYAQTGVRAAIYVSPSFWSKYMGNTPTFALAGYPVLWIAHWTTAAQPTMPAVNWGGEGWTFWQYTSSGAVPGISGRVDLDRYRFTDFTPVLVPSLG